VVCETSDADSGLRERLERMRREAEYSRKKLERQHEEAVEEHEAAKKLLDRKVLSHVMLLSHIYFGRWLAWEYLQLVLTFIIEACKCFFQP